MLPWLSGGPSLQLASRLPLRVISPRVGSYDGCPPQVLPTPTLRAELLGATVALRECQSVAVTLNGQVITTYKAEIRCPDRDFTDHPAQLFRA